MKKGRIETNGVILQPHELLTIKFLAKKGFDISLIPKSNKFGEHSPDIEMLGLKWEIKCPKGKGKYLIQNTLHRAARQSENVVIDLCRIKIPQTYCLAKIRKEFELTKHLRHVKVITKFKKVIDFVK